MGRTVDQSRMGVRCARTSFGVEIKNEAVFFSPRKRERIGAVRMPSEPCDESFFIKIGLTWGSTLVHNHVLLGYAVLYVPPLVLGD